MTSKRNSIVPITKYKKPEIKNGHVFHVGEFFWLPNSDDLDFIGYAEDAIGTYKDGGGSADIHCKIKILLAGSDGKSTVLLIRHTMPKGAQAAHGSIFRIRNSTILSWDEAIKFRVEMQEQRASIIKEIGKVKSGKFGGEE